MADGSQQKKPISKKVAAQTWAGAAVTLIAGILDRFGVSLTPAETGALVVLVGALGGYFKSED